MKDITFNEGKQSEDKTKSRGKIYMEKSTKSRERNLYNRGSRKKPKNKNNKELESNLWVEKGEVNI